MELFQALVAAIPGDTDTQTHPNKMLDTLDPAARCRTGQRGPEVGVPGVGVCPGAEELQHDVVVAAARRQVERGLGLVVLVIHRVAVLAVVSGT